MSPSSESDSKDTVQEIMGQILESPAGRVMANQSPGKPACPSCATRPLLERFPRYEVITYEPLWYCPSCYGFWARGDSLSRGVADPYTDHAALRQVPVSRCRECVGQLDADQECMRCGWVAPVPGCPACSTPMQRVRDQSLTLDLCAACKGIWFETGEICVMFGLAGEPASLVARTIPQPPEGEGMSGMDVADIILMALSFLPLP